VPVRVQAALVSAVWLGVVLWLGLPLQMFALGVPFAFLYAWLDERKRAPASVHTVRDYAVPEWTYEYEQDDDGIVWL
jgi:hypothetical protein